MTAKEFLTRVRALEQEIDKARRGFMHVDRMRERLEAGRMSRLDGMPRKRGVSWTDTADQMIDLEREIQAKIGELRRLKELAVEAIDQVETERLRDVLTLYYIKGYGWATVAEAMGIDERKAHRMHERALAQVKVPVKILYGG